MADPIDTFIQKWSTSDGSERANYALFLNDFCQVLDLEPPQLWHDMASGAAFSTIIMQAVPWFNDGLFEKISLTLVYLGEIFVYFRESYQPSKCLS